MKLTIRLLLLAITVSGIKLQAMESAENKEELEKQINELEARRPVLENVILEDTNSRTELEASINRFNNELRQPLQGYPHEEEIREETKMALRYSTMDLEEIKERLLTNQQALDSLKAQLSTAKEALKKINEKDGGENPLKDKLVGLKQKLNLLRQNLSELAKKLTTLKQSLRTDRI